MSTDDRIALTGLRVRGRHGVLAQERRDGQEFVVDAVLERDLSTAGRTDRLTDTVDYGALAQDLAAVVAGEPVDLIETLAERLAAVCLAREGVQRVRLTVHKPEAPIPLTPVPLTFDDVAVTIVRP